MGQLTLTTIKELGVGYTVVAWGNPAPIHDSTGASHEASMQFQQTPNKGKTAGDKCANQEIPGNEHPLKQPLDSRGMGNGG